MSIEVEQPSVLFPSAEDILQQSFNLDPQTKLSKETAIQKFHLASIFELIKSNPQFQEQRNSNGDIVTVSERPEAIRTKESIFSKPKIEHHPSYIEITNLDDSRRRLVTINWEDLFQPSHLSKQVIYSRIKVKEYTGIDASMDIRHEAYDHLRKFALWISSRDGSVNHILSTFSPFGRPQK